MYIRFVFVHSTHYSEHTLFNAYVVNIKVALTLHFYVASSKKVLCFLKPKYCNVESKLDSKFQVLGQCSKNFQKKLRKTIQLKISKLIPNKIAFIFQIPNNFFFFCEQKSG